MRNGCEAVGGLHEEARNTEMLIKEVASDPWVCARSAGSGPLDIATAHALMHYRGVDFT